jgi:CheY-like chemotaxis protein
MNATSREARILLVDDNASDVELTLESFAEAHLANRIDVARSGQEALDRLFGRTSPPDGEDYALPDLILLDLRMPGVDGLEVLRRIKTAPVVRSIPVIVLTSSSQERDRAQSYDTGANSYIVKPVSFEGMLEVARAIEHYWMSINIGPPLPGSDVLDQIMKSFGAASVTIHVGPQPNGDGELPA